MSPTAETVARLWQGEMVARRRRALAWLALFVVAVGVAAQIGQVDLRRLADGLPRAGDYIARTIPTLRIETLGGDFAEWMWGLDIWVGLLLDTVLIAYTGTVLGAFAGLMLSFAAAATLAPRWAVTGARRLLEFARTVPTLVFALIFVYAFGLGPFAGMLAVALHTMGALGKLFAEVHENADLRTVEAVRSAGGSWAQAMRFGVLPQSLPGVLSFGLLRFEINVREASVLGIVGAGGIGEELYLAVRQFEYPDISAIVLLILGTVALIDQLCARLRHRILGAEALRVT
ncbi:phosphonate ABC transporter, permease protein PhnE [Falsiroseomonas sp.]|uniref:phosphonate ABC transporter, permease protein PhnE n=1 Tax=Falsiroseomonas sp. TaxID=2870721 RepID=UPI003563476D